MIVQTTSTVEEGATVDDALVIERLRASVGDVTLVDGIDLTVRAGECVALVGPSGSGKTVTARAALGLSAPGVRVTADALRIAGRDVRGASERAWRRVRGALVGYVGQEALGALDPLRPVGREVADALRLHTRLSPAERTLRVREALEQVALDPALATDGTLAGALSGGMRQRALIAAATVANPRLIVADEPTTALDAAIAVSVMTGLRAAQERGAGLLLITHDRALVEGWADRVVTMQAGRLVPQPPAPVTHVASRPALRGARHADPREPASAHSAVLRADGLTVHFGERAALSDVALAVQPGSVLGVVGASGSGKTTLTRVLLGLLDPDRGTVSLDGEPWSPCPERFRRPRRPRMGAVVQDPGATFDDRWSVERVLVDALSGGRFRRSQEERPTDAEVDAALQRVGLDPALRSRSPRTLSGGQRQRLAIARALATDPSVLVLDEPVTALDAEVQDAVLGLLERLRDETDVAMVFVSHDLDAVRRMADEVLVIDAGRVVETGPAARVLAQPTHPVTVALVRAAAALTNPAVTPARYPDGSAARATSGTHGLGAAHTE